MSADNVEATEDPLQNLQSRKVDENEDDDGAVVDYRRMLGYLLPLFILILYQEGQEKCTQNTKEGRKRL